MRKRTLAAIIVIVGFFVGFGSGLVENGPAYFGFPIAWRMVDTSTGDKVAYPLELSLDILFGIGMVAIVATVTILTERWVSNKNKKTR